MSKITVMVHATNQCWKHSDLAQYIADYFMAMIQYHHGHSPMICNLKTTDIVCTLSSLLILQ